MWQSNYHLETSWITFYVFISWRHCLHQAISWCSQLLLLSWCQQDQFFLFLFFFNRHFRNRISFSFSTGIFVIRPFLNLLWHRTLLLDLHDVRNLPAFQPLPIDSNTYFSFWHFVTETLMTPALQILQENYNRSVHSEWPTNSSKTSISILTTA